MMKRLAIILLLTFIPLFAQADGDPGTLYFNHVVDLYEAGQYDQAKLGFSVCIEKFSAVVSIQNCKDYIRLCDNALNARQAARDRARREREKAEAEEREAFLKKEKARIDNKLIYIITDARTLDSDYSQFSFSVVNSLEDSGYRFTEKQEDALWSIYIMASTSKLFSDDPTKNEVFFKNHRVEVVAFYKIINESDGTILPGGEGRCSESLGSRTSYSEATYLTYEELCTPLCEAIIKVIK